MPIKRSP